MVVHLQLRWRGGCGCWDAWWPWAGISGLQEAGREGEGSLPGRRGKEASLETRRRQSAASKRAGSRVLVFIACKLLCSPAWLRPSYCMILLLAAGLCFLAIPCTLAPSPQPCFVGLEEPSALPSTP